MPLNDKLVDLQDEYNRTAMCAAVQAWLPSKARLSNLPHVESRLVLIVCSRAWPMSTAQSRSTHAMEPPFTWRTSLS